ncbi:MAG: ASPIC/UnbV domain-containing protein [Akkermansiaceae bacterium]
MTDRLRKGGSLSGRERNCAFLNLDGGSFATVSGVSGFDFPDDSRALALVDWDGDGLMDVWTSNRTAPRLRFLHNSLPQAGNWIQFGLEAEGMLDPIGARVEVTLGDDRKLMRTLRAGEGFLGQSSRFLHFGLADEEIRQIKVRWPDGKWQEVALVAPGRRYLLRKGSATAVPLETKKMAVPEKGALEKEPDKALPWIRMPLSLAMPPLVATRADGGKAVLPPVVGKPFLINLWDPECEDCTIELQEWKAGRGKLPKDLQVATLLANTEMSLEDGRKFVEGLQLPFAWGRLEPDSARLLAKFLQEIFQTRDSFPAPATFLVNGQGELVSFSIGKVTVDEIVAEVAVMPGAGESTDERLARVYGEGVWLSPVEHQNLLFVPRALMARGLVDQAATYVRRAWKHLSRHRDIDLVLVWIGDGYFKAGNSAEGLKFYLNALANGTEDPVVMNNVAWQLATHKDPKIRNGDLALKWAEQAVEVSKGREATYFDTLAAAYAEKGLFPEALKTVEKGLEIAKATGDQAAMKDLLRGKQLYSRNLPHRGQ